MDRFEALPTPQKALIVFLAMAAVAGLFYFLLISDAESRITAAQTRLRQAQTKKAQLDKYGGGELLRDLEAEEAELQEQLAVNKALLPEEEKIPALITSIKRQADERGLKINMFKKTERRPDDYVDIIPVKMEVEGSFPVVVSFFDALAQPGMRMMTVEDLELEAIPVRRQMKDGPGSGAEAFARATGRAAGARQAQRREGLSPAEQFLQKLERYEQTVERMKITANFTVNAYSYTGELLSAEERQDRKRRRRQRRR
ncbi:MAG: type 4a pilus biogenesis protein PilO [Myxococcota bacterium]